MGVGRVVVVQMYGGCEEECSNATPDDRTLAARSHPGITPTHPRTPASSHPRIAAAPHLWQAAEHGSLWLGQMVQGQWEIRSGAAQAALRSLLELLVDEGAVCAVAAPSRARRGQGGADRLYIVANRYIYDESWVASRRGGGGAADGEEGEEKGEKEELAEVEKERQRNIQRNKLALQALGLA